MEAENGEELEEEFLLPLAQMPYNAVGHTYVCVRRTGKFAVDKYSCTLKFKCKEVDPGSGEAEEEGYEDEYQVRSQTYPRELQATLVAACFDVARAKWSVEMFLPVFILSFANRLFLIFSVHLCSVVQLEDLEVTVLDYMQKTAVTNFRKSWEDISEEAEQTDVYGLGARDSLQEAVEAVMEILGMQSWYASFPAFSHILKTVQLCYRADERIVNVKGCLINTDFNCLALCYGALQRGDRDRPPQRALPYLLARWHLCRWPPSAGAPVLRCGPGECGGGQGGSKV
eukprot:2494604-Pyramimonas_sp.AAC.1